MTTNQNLNNKKKKGEMALLLKHGLKETAKEMIIACSLMVGAFLLISLIILIANIQFLNSVAGTIIMIITIIFIACAIIASGIMLLLTIIKTINQKLFTNEGYLTFTLPISIDKLIISKIIVNLIWILFYIMSVYIGVVLMFLICANKLFDVATLGEVAVLVSDIGASLLSMDFATFISVIGVIITIALTSITELLLLFVCLALANSSSKSKNKTVFAVIIYMLISGTIFSILEVIYMLFGFGFGYDINGNFKLGFGFTNNMIAYTFNFASYIVLCGAIVGFYFLGRYLLKNKLELQ